MTVLLILGAIAGLAVAILTFIANSQTPLQLGPVPFFGGALVFVVCIVSILARHVVWH